MKYEDDLHNCTPERLAEMLDGIAAGMIVVLHLTKDAAICHEAARRLRELNKPTFNNN